MHLHTQKLAMAQGQYARRGKYFKISLTTKLTEDTKMPFPLCGIGMFVWKERETPRSLLLCEGKRRSLR